MFGVIVTTVCFIGVVMVLLVVDLVVDFSFSVVVCLTVVGFDVVFV